MATVLAGDFFVGTRRGDLGHYREDGTYLELFNNTSGVSIFAVTGVAVASNGTIYALAQDGGATGYDVYKIDTSFAYVSRLTTNPFGVAGKEPGDIAVLPTGDLLVSVVDTGTSDIELWRLSPTGTVVHQWTGLSKDTGYSYTGKNWPKILVDCDGTTVYYTDLGKTIFRYDITGSGTQLANFMQLSGPDATDYAYYAMTLGATGNVVVTLTRLDSLNSFGPIYGLALTSSTRIWGDELQIDGPSGYFRAQDFNPSTGAFLGHTTNLRPQPSNANRSYISCMAAYYTVCSVVATTAKMLVYTSAHAL